MVDTARVKSLIAREVAEGHTNVGYTKEEWKLRNEIVQRDQKVRDLIVASSFRRRETPEGRMKRREEVIRKTTRDYELRKQGEVDQLGALELGQSLSGEKVVAVKGEEVGEEKGEIFTVSEEDVKPMTKFQSSEQVVSAKVTKPASMWVQEKTGYDIREGAEKFFEPLPEIKALGEGIQYTPLAEKMGYADWESGFTQKVEPYRIAGQEFTKGSIVGFVEGIEDRPIKMAAMTGAFFVLPKGLSLVGKAGGLLGAGKLASKFPLTTKIVAKSVKWGLPALYGGSVVGRVALTPGGIYQKGETFGMISATEILTMTAGGYAGSKFWPKFEGWWATRGRTQLSTEKLVPSDVLYGKKTFPEASTKQHLKLFKYKSQRIPGIKEPTMFHATGEKFWDSKLIADIGKSEFKGLYGSYGISPHFLRTSGEGTLYGGSLFQPYGKPGVVAVIPKGFVRGYSAPSGKAFVPGVKMEVEAILPPGTEASLIGKDYYFRWGGQRIPIDIFKVGTGTGLTTTTGATTLGAISSSYSGVGSYPIFTPGSYLGGSVSSLLSSYKPTKISSSIGYPISSKRRPVSSSKSPISYKPPTSRSFSSYKPSSSPTSILSSYRSPVSSSYSYYPPRRKTPPPPFILFPMFSQKLGKERVKGKRKFIRTPSVGATIKFQLGFESPKLPTSLEETGLVARPFIEPVQFGSLAVPLPKKPKKKKSVDE